MMVYDPKMLTLVSIRDIQILNIADVNQVHSRLFSRRTAF